MLYILYGLDDFSLNEGLRKIKRGLDNSEMLAANTATLDAKQLNLGELKDICSTAPFLSQARLVIVNGLLKRFELRPRQSRGGRHIAESKVGGLGEWQTLGVYIGQMPASTTLVLVDGRIDNRNPLLKELSSLAKVMRFPLLRGKSLRAWIQNRVVEKGGTITPQALNWLAELVGGNLWIMEAEIDKLVLYAYGRPIEESDVGKLVSYAREVSVFSLVDAILDGEAKTAHRLLHQLLQDGVPAAYLLVMLGRQLRLVVCAKELRQELPRRELQTRLGLTSDYALDKVLRQAGAYKMERLRHLYRGLLETDLAIKTGKYDSELALDLLIVELAT